MHQIKTKSYQNKVLVFINNNCSLDFYNLLVWIMWLLLLGRKVMTNLDSIFKSRDITLLTKVHLVKAMVFPVVMYGWESWSIKRAEHRRIDAFELWCWRRLLRDPWTARKSNQSILKEISPEYSLEGLMLKPKHQYFGHLMRITDSLEKTLMLGKIEDWRWEEKGMTEDEMVGWHDLDTTKQLNWTELKTIFSCIVCLSPGMNLWFSVFLTIWNRIWISWYSLYIFSAILLDACWNQF